MWFWNARCFWSRFAVAVCRLSRCVRVSQQTHARNKRTPPRGRTLCVRRSSPDGRGLMPSPGYYIILPAQVTHITHVMRGDDHVGHRRINSRSAHNQKWFRPGAREGQNKIALDIVTEKAWCTCSLRLCRAFLRCLIFDLLPQGFSTLHIGDLYRNLLAFLMFASMLLTHKTSI